MAKQKKQDPPEIPLKRLWELVRWEELSERQSDLVRDAILEHYGRDCMIWCNHRTFNVIRTKANNMMATLFVDEYDGTVKELCDLTGRQLKVDIFDFDQPLEKIDAKAAEISADDEDNAWALI